MRRTDITWRRDHNFRAQQGKSDRLGTLSARRTGREGETEWMLRVTPLPCGPFVSIFARIKLHIDMMSVRPKVTISAQMSSKNNLTCGSLKIDVVVADLSSSSA